MTTWFRREFQWRKLSLEHDQPQDFTQSQWQCRCSWLFLVYRCVLAGFLLVTLIMSVEEVRVLQLPLAKWLIYATDWSFLSLTAQALLAVFLVTKYRLTNTTADVMTWLHKTYWSLTNIASTLAPAVSLGYWIGVYHPKFDELDFVNMSMHAANSAIVVLDLFICSHPIRLLHVYQPLSVATVYLGFSGIYYLAGGTDYFGSGHLYPFLDWSTPWMVVLLAPLAGLCLVLIHTSLWLLYLLRCKVAETLTRGRDEGQALLTTQSV